MEFYVNENTFKERLKLFFIKNQRSSEWAWGWGGGFPGEGSAVQGLAGAWQCGWR